MQKTLVNCSQESADSVLASTICILDGKQRGSLSGSLEQKRSGLMIATFSTMVTAQT